MEIYQKFIMLRKKGVNRLAFLLCNIIVNASICPLFFYSCFDPFHTWKWIQNEYMNISFRLCHKNVFMHSKVIGWNDRPNGMEFLLWLLSHPSIWRNNCMPPIQPNGCLCLCLHLFFCFLPHSFNLCATLSQHCYWFLDRF